MTHPCRHCQTPCPGGAHFCCVGCEAVFHALSDAGLAAFYDLRGGPGIPVTEQETARLPDVELREIGDGTVSTLVGLDGVHCAGCVWLVERMPDFVDGVVEARLNLGRGRVEIRWQAGATDFAAIASWLGRFGYTPYSLDAARGEIQENRERQALVKVGVNWALASNVMLLIVAMYAGLDPSDGGLWTGARWLAMLLSAASLLYGGAEFTRRAVASLVPFRGFTKLGVDVPVAIGLYVGWLYSAYNTVRGTGEVWFDSVAVLIAALLTARWLHARGLRIAADATNRLGAVVPRWARRLVADGTVEEVPATSLSVGDLVEVRNGDLVPADGLVVHGSASLDRALLTGESVPELAEPGSRVWAGESSVRGSIHLRVEAVGIETRFGRLQKWVMDSDRSEAATVRLADKLAGAFVLTILAGAAVTALWAAFAAPAELVPRVVALLVVSCPCALGMATPLAFSVAAGRVARKGIFVRDDGVFERLDRVDTIILDKTGTLTTGRMRIAAIRGDESAVVLAAALERHSNHPVARAFAPYDRKDCAVSGFDEKTARGVSGWVDGKQVCARAAERSESAFTTVTIEVDGAPVAEVEFVDTVRREAEQLVRKWTAAGIDVWIASGDAAGPVEAVASEVGIPPSRALAAQTPESKFALVQALSASGRTVAMIGDGVNDAAALREAGVGIAMFGGAQLNAVAADVQLTRAGLSPVDELLTGSTAAMRAVRRNLVLSALYNVLALAAAAAGLVSPLVAAIAMPLSSIAVVASSLAQGLQLRRATHNSDGAGTKPVAAIGSV